MALLCHWGTVAESREYNLQMERVKLKARMPIPASATALGCAARTCNYRRVLCNHRSALAEISRNPACVGRMDLDEVLGNALVLADWTEQLLTYAFSTVWGHRNTSRAYNNSPSLSSNLSSNPPVLVQIRGCLLWVLTFPRYKARGEVMLSNY